jgi:hypothetical protein
MNTSKFLAIALIAILSLQMVSSRIEEPHAMYREVEMDQTYQKLIDYVKSGAHDRYKNSDYFHENHQNETIGKCGPGVEPHPWKFLGYTVAQLNDQTPKSVNWSNHCFQSSFATFKWNGPMEAQLTINSKTKKYAGCSDTYSISDVYNFDIKVVEDEGDHLIIYKFKH